MASLEPNQAMVFDALYGLEFGETTPDRVTATVPVTPKILQPFGIVHGGVFCAIGETLASIGTYLGVKDAGNISVGMSNHTRPSDLVSSSAAASAGCSETPVALIHLSCTGVPPAGRRRRRGE